MVDKMWKQALCSKSGFLFLTSSNVLSFFLPFSCSQNPERNFPQLNPKIKYQYYVFHILLFTLHIPHTCKSDCYLNINNTIIYFHPKAVHSTYIFRLLIFCSNSSF